jgi:hypothetical protein
MIKILEDEMEAGNVNYGLVGMLWFDNSKDALDERVRRAAAYYGKKFGKEAMVAEAPVCDIQAARMVDHLVVLPNKSILPHHMILFYYYKNQASQPDPEVQSECASERLEGC